jgi:hypothetical protein
MKTAADDIEKDLEETAEDIEQLDKDVDEYLEKKEDLDDKVEDAGAKLEDKGGSKSDGKGQSTLGRLVYSVLRKHFASETLQERLETQWEEEAKEIIRSGGGTAEAAYDAQNYLITQHDLDPNKAEQIVAPLAAKFRGQDLNPAEMQNYNLSQTDY